MRVSRHDLAAIEKRAAGIRGCGSQVGLCIRPQGDGGISKAGRLPTEMLDSQKILVVAVPGTGTVKVGDNLMFHFGGHTRKKTGRTPWPLTARRQRGKTLSP